MSTRRSNDAAWNSTLLPENLTRLHQIVESKYSSIRPDFVAPLGARFVVENERQFPGFNPIYLFRDGLAFITPLLWLLFALNLMGYFFLASWTPTLLAAARLPAERRPSRAPCCVSSGANVS